MLSIEFSTKRILTIRHFELVKHAVETYMHHLRFMWSFSLEFET